MKISKKNQMDDSLRFDYMFDRIIKQSLQRFHKIIFFYENTEYTSLKCWQKDWQSKVNHGGPK